MRCVASISVTVIAIALICWRFPLFHIVPLQRAAQEKAAVAFNPESFALEFWNGRLLKSLDQAVKVGSLLPAIRENPADARKKYSHSLGLSDSYIYFLSGTGRIVAVGADEISLQVSDTAGTPEIALETGLVFGNTVRDGTGLLNVNDFPNSQDFNDISSGLNRIIETRVLPDLKANAAVGRRVEFVGCAEVADESTDLKPLKVIPISAKIQ